MILIFFFFKTWFSDSMILWKTATGSLIVNLNHYNIVLTWISAGSFGPLTMFVICVVEKHKPWVFCCMVKHFATLDKHTIVHLRSVPCLATAVSCLLEDCFSLWAWRIWKTLVHIIAITLLYTKIPFPLQFTIPFWEVFRSDIAI